MSCGRCVTTASMAEMLPGSTNSLSPSSSSSLSSSSSSSLWPALEAPSVRSMYTRDPRPGAVGWTRRGGVRLPLRVWREASGAVREGGTTSLAEAGTCHSQEVKMPAHGRWKSRPPRRCHNDAPQLVVVPVVVPVVVAGDTGTPSLLDVPNGCAVACRSSTSSKKRPPSWVGTCLFLWWWWCCGCCCGCCCCCCAVRPCPSGWGGLAACGGFFCVGAAL